MKEQVEVEGDVLAGVVDAHVHVELLLPQDKTVGDAERAGENETNPLIFCQKISLSSFFTSSRATSCSRTL